MPIKFFLFVLLLMVSAPGLADTVESGHIKMTSFITRIKVADDFSYETENELEYKVLTEQGARQEGTFPISYNRALTRVQIVQAETIKADGRRIPVPDSGIARQSGSLGQLTFKEMEIISLSFPDLATGDSVHLRYRSENQPQFPGYFFFTSNVNENLIWESIETELDVPKNLKLYLDRRNFITARDVVTQGRRNLIWRYANPIVKKSEIAQIDTLQEQPHIWISTFPSWKALAKAYMDRHAPQAGVTPEIAKLAQELTQGAASEREKAQRIYDWVRKNIRYVAIYAGVEGWVPHQASAVLASRFGDCKDHVVLMDALLHAIGIESVPVLIQANLANYRRPPLAIPFFNHAISYLPGLDLYLDSTSPFAEFGRLPEGDQGKPVLRAGLASPLGTTPASKADEKSARRDTQVRIDEKGDARIETTLWFSGDFRTWYAQFQQEIGNGKENSWAAQYMGNQKRRGRTSLKFLPEEDGRLGLRISQTIEDYLQGGEIGLLNFEHIYVGPASIFSVVDLFQFAVRQRNFACAAVSIEDKVEIVLPGNLKLLRLPRNQEIEGDGYALQVRYTANEQRHEMNRHFRWEPGQTGACSTKQWYAWQQPMQKIRSALTSGVLAYERN